MGKSGGFCQLTTEWGLNPLWIGGLSRHHAANIVLDDKLVAEVMRITQARSKYEVVDMTLRVLLKHKAYEDVQALRGKGLTDPNFDVAEMRRLAGEKARERTTG